MAILPSIVNLQKHKVSKNKYVLNKYRTLLIEKHVMLIVFGLFESQ